MGSMKVFESSLDSAIERTIAIRKRMVHYELIASFFDKNLKFIPAESPFFSLKSTLNRDEIAQGIIDLDNKAFTEVYRISYPKIRGMVLQNGGNVADAEDIFQRSLMILVEKIQRGTFTELRYSITTYIYGVAKFVWKNYKKRQSIEDRIFVRDPWSSGSQFPADSIIKGEGMEIEKPEDFNPISKALDELSDSCKALIDEFYYKKGNWVEIAQSLGYANDKSAKNQKYKCIEKLKLRIAGYKFNVI